MGTLIKRGTIVTATESYRSDILIENEKIAVIGSGLEARADQVIDAKGNTSSPAASTVTRISAFPSWARRRQGLLLRPPPPWEERRRS